MCRSAVVKCMLFHGSMDICCVVVVVVMLISIYGNGRILVVVMAVLRVADILRKNSSICLLGCGIVWVVVAVLKVVV